ncbi:MAG: polyhydroxyalkanoate depolymerase, partial [Bacteroidia bacterium]|nr:polyhydroxyalkanoate depolymerase [Bacteroidia bacterium]
WRDIVYPQVKAFILENNQAPAQAKRAAAAPKKAARPAAKAAPKAAAKPAAKKVTRSKKA